MPFGDIPIRQRVMPRAAPPPPNPAVRIAAPVIPAPVAEPTEPKEKAVFPIYFTLVTDGPLPGKHNLLHVSASFSPDLEFSRNIQPQAGRVRTGARLTDELITRLSIGAVPIGQAMQDLATWLDRFKGARLPVTSALAFWHLVYHMSALMEKMPFVSNPIDVNSFHAGSKADLKATRLVKGKDPVSAMAQRRKIIEEAIADGGSIRW